MGLNCAIEKRVQVITPHAEVISHELMRLRSGLLNPKFRTKKWPILEVNLTHLVESKDLFFS